MLANGGDSSDIDLSDDELADDPSFVDNAANIFTATSTIGNYSSSESSECESADEDDEPHNRKENRRLIWKKNKMFFPSFDVCPNDTDDDPDPLLRKDWKALQYFEQYISIDDIKNMAEKTNIRYFLVKGKELATTTEEMAAFIGMSMFMSVLGFPRIKMFFARKTRVPIVADTISRDRYFNIRSNLKVVNDAEVDQEQKKDKLWKVRPIFESVRKGCLALPRTKDMSIDEQIIPFTGNTGLKQYIANKPNPWGLKNFVLASTDGQVLDFETYQGKGTFLTNEEGEKMGVGESAVTRLLESVPKGSHVYFDRYFTTIKLLEALTEKEIYGSGTIMRSRIPKATHLLADKELARKGRGESDQSVRGDGKMCVVKWFDNKPVTLASNAIGIQPEDECSRWSKKDKERIKVKRPLIVNKYNMSMGGVDLCDRMLAFYRMKGRTRKWTVRCIFHAIDLAVVNSWIQYRADRKAAQCKQKDVLQLLDFKIELGEQLIAILANRDSDVSDSDLANEPTPSKRLKISPIPSKNCRGSGRHMPELCDQKESSRCRKAGCSYKTKFRCIDCKVFLCITSNRNCFKTFHQEK